LWIFYKQIHGGVDELIFLWRLNGASPASSMMGRAKLPNHVLHLIRIFKKIIYEN